MASIKGDKSLANIGKARETGHINAAETGIKRPDATYETTRWKSEKWCPGAESNHRHEDFQSGNNFYNLIKSATYDASHSRLCQ